MADFNVDMSSPQGGATQVVAPVQVAPVPEFNINQVIATGANLFGDFLQNKNKADAAAAQNSVISEYSQSEDRIAQLVKTGALSATEARSRSQSNFSKYIGSNPGLYKDLEAVRKSRMEGTATGDVYDEVKAAKVARERADVMLEDLGMAHNPWDSEETKEANRKTGFEIKKLDVETKRRYAKQDQDRANTSAAQSTTTFQNSIEDREEKQRAAQSLNNIVSSNFDSISRSVQDGAAYIEKAPDKTLAYNEVVASLGKRMGEIRATATAIGGGNNQPLVDAYLKTFEDMNRVGLELIKPGAKTEQLKNEWEAMLYRSKIAFGSRPGVMGAVAANSLVPQNPRLTNDATDIAVEAVAAISRMDFTSELYKAPPIIGVAGVEGSVLDIVKGGLEALQKDKDVLGNKPALTSDTTNSVHTILRQTGAAVKQGLSPQGLTKVMSFYADTPFGVAAANGAFDQQALREGNDALITYSRAVVRSVDETLQKYVGPVGRSKGVPTQMSEFVDLNFSGGKVNVVPIGKGERTTESVSALKKSEEAITRLVFAGAHLSGTQDYAKYWETNKHLLLPNMYADPQKFPTGFINPKNGWKFKGGAFYNESNWEKPKDATK